MSIPIHSRPSRSATAIVVPQPQKGSSTTRATSRPGQSLPPCRGQANFRNEIIWRRTGYNSAAKRFGPIHQNIYLYGKTADAPFYPVHGPYTEGYVEDYFKGRDERGRYRPVLLTGSGKRKGESGKKWRHYDPTSSSRHWAIPKYVLDKYEAITGESISGRPTAEVLDRLDEAGLIHWGKKEGSVPNYKYYLSDAPGVALQDIWAYQPGTEGTVYGTKDRELVGYPTQKPEGVLERIIRASSKKGDGRRGALPEGGAGQDLRVAVQVERARLA